MSEYTPDTAFIRRCASDDGYTGELASSREFDRWLASVKAEAWEEGALAHGEAEDYFPENPYRTEN